MEGEVEYKRVGSPTVGEGTIEAVFAVFGNADRVQDIIEPGAIKDGVAVAMVWHHRWDEPVGKGIVSVDSTRAVFKGAFFMDTLAGQEAYKTVKAMDDLQQWSFGYRPIVRAYEERDGEFYRILKELEIFEVSPVLIGANPHTGTLSVKGLPLSDHIEAARDTVRDVMARAKTLAELRAGEGRRVGKQTLADLGELRKELAEAIETVDALSADHKAAESLFLEYQQVLAAL